GPKIPAPIPSASYPVDLYAGVGEGQAASFGDVRNQVLELQIGKTNAVGKAASVEVHSDRMHARVVLVGIDRIAKAKAGRQEVSKVGVAVKGMRVMADSVIRLGQQIGLTKRLAEAAIQGVNRARERARRGGSLFGA